MKKFLSTSFLCLLTVAFLSSCNNVSFDKEKFNKLIGRSPSASYTLDVSEGKTETEKTLIVKYNNMVEAIISGSEKNKNGEEITPQEKLEYLRLQNDLVVFIQKNEYNISRELLTKIAEKAQSIEIIEKKTNKDVEGEEPVDLNDYFNSSTGWDDETDWNYAGVEDEESQKAFNKVLEKNGIYWSDQKQCWVKKVKKTAEQAPMVKFKDTVQNFV